MYKQEVELWLQSFVSFYLTEGSEEKKKDGSPVRSSSTSKDYGSSEKGSVAHWRRRQLVYMFAIRRKFQSNKNSSSLLLLSSKSSEGPPSTPTSPTTTTLSQVTSFPPAPVTMGCVRSKSRELLVVALQTDGEKIMKSGSFQTLNPALIRLIWSYHCLNEESVFQ